jgi:uncharacterized protein (DUF697 family)
MLDNNNNGFDNMKEEADEVLKLEADARKVVLGFTTAAIGTGAVPFPFADMPLLIGEQVAMMSSVCAVYGIKVEKDGLKMLVVQVIGTGGASLLGKTVATNLIKLVPVGGTAVGGVISAATAGTITFALGMSFIKVCNDVRLGKLSEKDMYSRETAKKMRKLFKEEVKNKNEVKDES